MVFRASVLGGTDRSGSCTYKDTSQETRRKSALLRSGKMANMAKFQVLFQFLLRFLL